MRIPRRVHLASGAIPVGITRTPEFFDIPAGATCITFYVTYFGGDASSQLDLDLEWTNGSEISRDTVVQSGIVITQPEGQYNVFETVRRGPQPGAAVTIDYEIAFSVPGGATGVRLVATGVNAGGIVQITLTGGSGGCPDGSTVVVNDAIPTPSGAIPAPSGFLIPRTVHLASQALPAAGAFTTQGFETVPAGTKRISFWISYTRGAAGGFPIFHPDFSNGTDTGRDIIKDSVVVITEPNGQFETPLSEPAGPQPQDGSALVWVETYDLPANTTGVRLLAAEAGVVGTPGTIAIAFTGDG